MWKLFVFDGYVEYVDTQGDDCVRGLTDRNLALLGGGLCFMLCDLRQWMQLSQKPHWTPGRHFKVCVFLIHEQSDIQVMVSNLCVSIHFCAVYSQDLHHQLLTRTLAAVSSQQMEEWLVHWPYGKCQSGISSQNTMFTVAECYPYG